MISATSQAAAINLEACMRSNSDPPSRVKTSEPPLFPDVMREKNSGVERATRKLSKVLLLIYTAGNDKEQGARCRAANHCRGRRGHFVPADVSRAQEVESLVKATVEKFGRLDSTLLLEVRYPQTLKLSNP